MSAAPIQLLPPRAAFTSEPIFRLTVDQYHELIRSGKLTDDDPVELLEGILTFKMPKNTPHATCTKLVRRELERLLPAGWHYQSQEPITLADGEPEPDGAIIRGRIEDYTAAHPGPADVAVVIEVSDTSLERDRGIKLRSYARAGIPIYWIINLLERQVEVHVEPTLPQDGEPNYARRTVHGATHSVSLQITGMAAQQVLVASFLPPAPTTP